MKLRNDSRYTGDVVNFPPSGYVTFESLNNLFQVGDRKDGNGKELFWKVDRGWKVKAGDAAGTVHLKANVVQINNTALRCHDVAFILQTGSFPEGDIIHLDGDAANHDIANLHVIPSKQRV
jgi:hypothetical protein